VQGIALAGQTPPRPEKVVAYITLGDGLLVLSHPHHQEAGIQVPAGTAKPGEPVGQAVLREAREETGLNGLRMMSALGAREYDLAPIGLTGRQRFHFFHLTVVCDAPARWRHFERHPSDGSAEPIEFELYWVAFPDQVPELIAPQGDFLCELSVALGCCHAGVHG
jgi:8-oxo-dGTP pyrophosphatase MutT (NUDIX family)